MIKINKEIQEAVKNNGWYCPCKVGKIPENKCPCLEFRKNKQCSCGLFVEED